MHVWANEQSIRETYLKPFEMSVKEGGAQAVMSSFNYIGYTYAGASSNLLQTVLRDEWGFKGLRPDRLLRRLWLPERRSGSACNDSMLATTKITNHITDKSATSVKAIRQAAQHPVHGRQQLAVREWRAEGRHPDLEDRHTWLGGVVAGARDAWG